MVESIPRTLCYWRVHNSKQTVTSSKVAFLGFVRISDGHRPEILFLGRCHGMRIRVAEMTSRQALVINRKIISSKIMSASVYVYVCMYVCVCVCVRAHMHRQVFGGREIIEEYLRRDVFWERYILVESYAE